jgi:N-acetylneuraminic acid mutarotase
MKQNICSEKLLLLIIIITLFTAVFFPISIFAQNEITATGTWQTISPASGVILGREENSYAAAGSKFYLIGGRGTVSVQEYNPVNKSWVNKAKPPIEIHHFQAVTLNGLIYAMGAMNGSYPHEVPLSKVYIYNPVSNKWIIGRTIPAARRRGAGGAIVYNNKIYLVGGIIDGHWTGHVSWFDEYNPATNTWKIMPNAPRARDHFQAVIINNKLYVAGGRRSSASTGQTFQLTVPEIDVFDFSLGTWSTLPGSSNLPVPRAGAANVRLGNEVIVIGGESGLQVEAHKETHALDVTTNKWRRLADLKEGRHGTGAVVSNKDIYIAAGAGNRGGTPKLLTQEDYFMFSHTSPNGASLSSSPLTGSSTLSFGSVAINSVISKTLTLSNTGSNQDIFLSSVTISGAGSFSYTAPYSFPFTISPGKSISLIVKFKPATSGAQTASLVISHSGQNGSKTVSLSGTTTTGTTVTSFTLINASTDTDIKTLNNNDVLNLATLPTRNLTIRANTSPATVGSVVFNLSGSQTKNQTESSLPYALFGDDKGDYNGWTPPVGSFTLKGTPYSASGGAGIAGRALTVSFSVTDQAVAAMQREAKTAENPAMKQSALTVAKAYPNPHEGRFTVMLPEKFEGEVSFMLISLSGTKLAGGKLLLRHPESTLTFDFSKEMISSGLYYLFLENRECKAFAKVWQGNQEMHR